jgi:plastocyanin
MRRAHPRSRAALIVFVLAVVSAACGGSGTSSAPTSITPSPSPTAASPSPAPSPTCAAASTDLAITAKGEVFDVSCLTASADTKLTITFHNEDAGLSHNVDILDAPGGTSLFMGDIVQGPTTVVYKVKALPAGSYYYRCDIHPFRMHGTLLVGR